MTDKHQLLEDKLVILATIIRQHLSDIKEFHQNDKGSMVSTRAYMRACNEISHILACLTDITNSKESFGDFYHKVSGK